MSTHLQEPITTCPEPALNKEDQEADERMVSLHAESIVNTVAFPMVLKAALELGVIDTIAAAGKDVWLSSYEITVSLPIKPMNPEASVLLDRMLRLLVSHSILKCRAIETGENGRAGITERVYAAEPVCKFFLKDSNGSGSLAALFLLFHTEVHFKTWDNLKDVILEGKDAFISAQGMKLFDYINSDAQFARVFHRAMSESATMVMKKVLEVYKGFEDVHTLVDVGGATGTILGLITSKYPHIKGVNFDLAQVLTNAPSYPGVEHVSGDMFIEVPKGDAIFMKWILHDWTDEHCADPGNIISTVTLNGTNYERWAKVMRNAFHAKNKLNFIDGLLQRPSPGTDHYKLWGIINSMMVAWILNTIDPDLRSSVSCSDTAYDLWQSLKERFSVGNDPLLYELQSSLNECKQEGLSVQSYYGKLKRMWDDLEDYDPLPPCCCGNTRCAQQLAHIARRDKERMSQFLMGLDGARFGATRSNILAMSPSPSLSAVYSLIQ
ncbi:hypothetical protein AALP_AA2G217200 [Arabis alpina]|uniref:O-methyltransferase domain-containing protein n=1 Tax=Arabis alpina TaxID=50452 RepID=A0A087HJ44_ARAAL|nr:hypothetical protein AALP_AA2G217200 [Arabis alpina]